MTLPQLTPLHGEFADDCARRTDCGGQASQSSPKLRRRRLITLNSDQAVHAIYSYFTHWQANPQIHISLRLLTISKPTAESGSNWPEAECGLQQWGKLQREEGTEEGLKALRLHLCNSCNLSHSARGFVQTADDESFLAKLIKRICWDTGRPEYDYVRSDIRLLLLSRSRAITEAFLASGSSFFLSPQHRLRERIDEGAGAVPRVTALRSAADHVAAWRSSAHWQSLLAGWSYPDLAQKPHLSAGSKGWLEARRRRFPGPGHRIYLVGGELRHSCNWEGRDACQQRGEALAPATWTRRLARAETVESTLVRSDPRHSSHTESPSTNWSSSRG
jgi:hypothetical protein